MLPRYKTTFDHGFDAEMELKRIRDLMPKSDLYVILQFMCLLCAALSLIVQFAILIGSTTTKFIKYERFNDTGYSQDGEVCKREETKEETE